LRARSTISEFIFNETPINAGSDYVSVWVIIEPRKKIILGVHMLVAEEFIQTLIRKYGNTIF
jgi:hypothetical protein